MERGQETSGEASDRRAGVRQRKQSATRNQTRGFGPQQAKTQEIKQNEQPYPVEDIEELGAQHDGHRPQHAKEESQTANR
jgi:hypothetical protein